MCSSDLSVYIRLSRHCTLVVLIIIITSSSSFFSRSPSTVDLSHHRFLSKLGLFPVTFSVFVFILLRSDSQSSSLLKSFLHFVDLVGPKWQFHGARNSGRISPVRNTRGAYPQITGSHLLAAPCGRGLILSATSRLNQCASLPLDR